MLTVYLDSCIVIYLLEGPASVRQPILHRLAPSEEPAPVVMVSDLTRMECRVGPLKRNDHALLSEYDDFFSRTDLSRAGFSAAVFDRAAELRAVHGCRTPDALHVAIAAANGCDEFWTNDRRLVAIGGLMRMVVLP